MALETCKACPRRRVALHTCLQGFARSTETLSLSLQERSPAWGMAPNGQVSQGTAPCATSQAPESKDTVSLSSHEPFLTETASTADQQPLQGRTARDDVACPGGHATEEPATRPDEVEVVKAA